jgi:hypothetical protein
MPFFLRLIGENQKFLLYLKLLMKEDAELFAFNNFSRAL